MANSTSKPKPPRWKYWATLTGLVVLAPLPPRLGYLMTRAISDFSFLLDHRSRASISSNVRHVLGPNVTDGRVSHVTREVFRNAGRNWLDMIRLPRFDADSSENKLTVHGWHHLEKAIARGRGVLLASVHMGNMDVAVQVIQARSIKLTILSEVLEPPSLDRLSRRLRGHNGMSLLPVTYSGLKTAIQRLKRGEVVAIACDRAIQGSGVLTEFMGKPALLPVGAVKLAHRTGASIVPAFTARLKDNHSVFYFEPPIEASANGGGPEASSQLFARIVALMEKYIRRFPGQWVVFDPIWETQPARPLNGAGILQPAKSRNGGKTPATLSSGLSRS